jgi:hypothetical protein
MCLATVDRLPSRESLLEEVEGWAVKRLGGDSIFRHSIPFNQNLVYGEHFGRKPAWGLAHIRTACRGPFADDYPSGFHIFRCKEDAENYLSGLRAWPLGKLEVRKVLGRGILAEGTQEGYPVVVVLELYPRE